MSRVARCLLTALVLVLAVAPAASAAKGNPWIKKRPLNIAHQGGEDEFPSNTMYAFKKAVRAGADMLELDIGVTKDDKVVVLHDTTVDGKTNGTGTVESKTLRQIKRLDAAYWFSQAGPNHYARDLPRRAYRFRGIATRKRRPPKGFKASDFRVPTLKEVLRAFPRTPINVEIKGRTPAEAEAEYVQNAESLARTLKRVKRRDIIVVSFQQPAVDRFHELLPAHRPRPRHRRRGQLDLRRRLARAGREGVPGPDHLRVRRHDPADHHEGERGPRAPRGLRLAELVQRRRPRRAGHVAHAGGHVRRRHHDLPAQGAGEGPAQEQAAGRLRYGRSRRSPKVEASGVRPPTPAAARRRP